MPKPSDFGFNEEAVVKEINDKIVSFEEKHVRFVQSVQRFWKLYKGDRPRPQPYFDAPYEGVKNSFVYETPRAVDALATTRYRLLMNDDVPWEVLAQRGDIPEDALYKISALHQFQEERVQYKRFLRKTLTSLDLIGTVIIEQPWVQWPTNQAEPIWEATGFIPRPISQIFFAPNAMTIDQADYIGTMDVVNKYRLMQLLNSDPNQEAWLSDGIQNAINDNEDEKMPEAVKHRLLDSGYRDFKGNKELDIYYGPLDSQNSYEEWVVGLVNRKHLVRFHKAPLPMRPFLVAHTTEIEQEPWAMGVGGKGEYLQQMLNVNRDRIFNLIVFGLFSMMKMSRDAGIKTSDLRIKPFNVIPVDNINGLEPLRPDLNATNYGIRMEEMLKDEFQGVTGATKNLQAGVSDVTATESALATDSAIRHISVDTEIMAEVLIRERRIFCHQMNLKFLDRPIWTNIVGANGKYTPIRIDPRDIQYDVDFKVKISTDKDFRPQMLRRMIEFLQVITSIKQQLPPELNLNLKPFIELIARLSKINPETV